MDMAMILMMMARVIIIMMIIIIIIMNTVQIRKIMIILMLIELKSKHTKTSISSDDTVRVPCTNNDSNNSDYNIIIYVIVSRNMQSISTSLS